MYLTSLRLEAKRTSLFLIFGFNLIHNTREIPRFCFFFVLFLCFHFFNNIFLYVNISMTTFFLLFVYFYLVLFSRPIYDENGKCNTGDDITKGKIGITSSNIKALLFISSTFSSYKLSALHNSDKLPALVK